MIEINKKNYLLAILVALCLTGILFITMPTRSNPESGKYDAWVDLNDDGVIDIFDAIILANAFGTSGTPINKTDVLIDLQQKVDSLNNTLNELQSDIDNSYNIRISAYCDLEKKEVETNITKDGLPPDYITPQIFWLTGTHTFTTSNVDQDYHPFMQWNTGSTNTTITVTAPGEYIAYYGNGLSVMETLVTSSDFGLYLDPTGGAEMVEIDWSSLTPGSNQSLSLYLKAKHGWNTNTYMTWTTNNTLSSYLHMNMFWNLIEEWPENISRQWNTLDVVQLKFTLTVDSDAPLVPASFTQTFGAHSTP